MKLSPCPICGHTPIITEESLGRGNGHGYPGYFDYHIKCSNSGNCPLSIEVPMFTMDDIYRKKEEAIQYLHDAWNREAARIDEMIAHRAERQE